MKKAITVIEVMLILVILMVIVSITVPSWKREKKTQSEEVKIECTASGECREVKYLLEDGIVKKWKFK